MKLDDIKKKALDLGVNVGSLKKPELIRAIQEAEGFPPSFGNNDGSCPYTQCCWWDDCIAEYKNKKAPTPVAAKKKKKK